MREDGQLDLQYTGDVSGNPIAYAGPIEYFVVQ